MESSLSNAALLVARWLSTVFDDSDLAAAWPVTDEPLRLALVQSWIMLEADRTDVAVVDRDDLARRLAAPNQSSDPLWLDFAGWRLIRWREKLPDFVTVADLRGTVSGEFVGHVDIEQVWITNSATTVVEGETIVAQRFLVRHVDDVLRVAGIGGVLPIPGWPPGETERL